MTLSLLGSYALCAVVFLLMISVLVAAHEYGHYLFARMFNMGVEEFAIGFGKKPILTWLKKTYVVPIGAGENPDIHGTASVPGNPSAIALASALEGSTPDRLIEKIDTPQGPALRETTNFTIRPWPLGGFVRIKGMLPEEDGSETKIPGGFYSKAPWQRFLVLFAGPLFSVLAGIIILIPVLMFDGKDVFWKAPVLGNVSSGSPADLAGLREGDRIVAINGETIHRFYRAIELVRASEGKSLRFEITRNGEANRIISVTPKMDTKATPLVQPNLEATGELAKTYKMGVSPVVRVEKLSFPAATVAAVGIPVDAVNGLLRLFRKPSEFSDTVGGPATMVTATARAVQIGIWKVLWLASVLSISVGIFNLLPTPPLDGGQMVMALAEMIRGGKRLSIRSQAIASGIGMTFVLALVMSAMFVDFKRFTTPAPKDSSTTSQKK